MTPFDNLIAFIGRDCRTASEIWQELTDLRLHNGPDPYRLLPDSKAELQRQLRAGKAAGLLIEEWPPGAAEASWRPGRKVEQPELF